MDDQRKRELAGGMNGLAQRFWAGEAEICRQFWGVPRTTGEQAHWLRLQVYKEMFGSGLHGHPGGIIRGFIEKALRDAAARPDEGAARRLRTRHPRARRGVQPLPPLRRHPRRRHRRARPPGEAPRLAVAGGRETPAGAPVRPRGPGPHRRGRDRLHRGRRCLVSTRDAR